jgi:SPIRAL1-like protein
MVRGGSSGGGQSSLGYLFGSDAGAPKAAARAPAPEPAPAPVEQRAAGFARHVPEEKPAPQVASVPAAKVEDAGTSLGMGAPKLGRNQNNYHRADGQNNGNFITDRPSTKVHSAPGGGSSLGYLFGGN